MGKQQVLLGMSGGIDSFVSALLLKEQGYQVVGVTFRFFGGEDPQPAELAATLGITHIYKDLRASFREKVIDAFINSYLAAQTPSPCSWCNRTMKWHQLAVLASEQGINHIATGHYVRVQNQKGHHYIFQGKDPVKDQSYFLWELEEAILQRALTPLGTYTKEQVREMAIAKGYPFLAAKKESMGVCFLQGQDYRQFLKQQLADWETHTQPGAVYNEEGSQVGTHRGLPNYTIGQKRELDLFPGAQGGYVKYMDTHTNSLVIAPKPALLQRRLMIDNVRFRNPDDLTEDKAFTVKVRGLGLNPEGLGRLKMVDANSWQVLLEEPAWAIAPGQPVVFYQGERLAGGGLAK